jgi:hypothetical protein
MYQASRLKDGVRSIGMALVFPLKVGGGPLFILLDSCSGQSHLTRRSTGRTLLYTALLVSIFLAIVAVSVGVYLINANQTLTFDDNQRLFNIFSVLVIALPSVLLLCAAATTLATDPLTSPQTQYTATPVVQMQRGF